MAGNFPSGTVFATVLALTLLPVAWSRLGSGAANWTEDLKRAEASLLPGAFDRGGPARGLEYWNLTGPERIDSMLEVGAADAYGHDYLATATQYADTCCSSCGAVDTAALVAGTAYYVVASAQAMQNAFGRGPHDTDKAGGCCWCGHAEPSCGHGSGTAPMGCGSCAKGRFIKKQPYKAPMKVDPQGIFDLEINIVVADICPHKGNEAWCPPRVGSTNVFGSKNHLDFASPPDGFDNYYFAFTPTPCSAEITHRMRSRSRCSL